MLGATILVMIIAFLLGIAVHGAFLYLAAAAFVVLVLGGGVWLWAMASRRAGFFSRRE